MNPEQQQTNDKTQQPPSTKANEKSEPVQISQPHGERADGPFKHSGETSRWTQEEKEEQEEQDQSGSPSAP